MNLRRPPMPRETAGQSEEEARESLAVKRQADPQIPNTGFISHDVKDEEGDNSQYVVVKVTNNENAARALGRELLHELPL